MTDLKDFNNKFNKSIFHLLNGLPSLKVLGLSGIIIHGRLHIQDINALKSLEGLDLSGNSFEDFVNSTILSGVSSEIKNNNHLQFHLNYVKCNTTKLIQSLATLPSIKSLSLQNNNITSIDAIHALRNHSNVDELILDNSYLYKDFLQSIGLMNALKVLSASGTQLKDTLPNTGWCELRKLQELTLSKNQLDGTLPPCLKLRI
nr:LRR receptor-like serine/threonine-protein kinase GSO2 [Ipomoea batatas]